MDHNSSYDYYPFNHLQHPLYFNPVSPVHVPPPPPPPPSHPEPEEQKDYHHYAPASPSDFIYNANSSVNTTAASIIHHHHRHPSRSSRSLFSNEPVLAYPPRTVGSRPAEQTFSPCLPGVLEPSLPQPAPGFEEHRRQHQHRRQRQSTMMTMGPGPSKSVPSPLSLPLSREGGRSGRRRMSGFSSGEETVVVIKREEEEEEEEEEEQSSSSVPWVSIPLEQRVKRWVPRVPRVPRVPQGKQGEQMKQVEEDAVGGVVGYVPLGTEESGISGSGTWEERGEGVVMVAGMGAAMGVGMEPTITPKMGLFKPIRWDGPSSASRAKAKARRVRAWETMEEQHGDVYLRRTPGIQNRSSNRDRNDETEDEKVSDAPISPHSRSPKRSKTSSSHSGYILRPGPCPAETKTDTEIKQEPSLSPPPSAVLAQIPMFDSFDSLPRNSGYESSGHDDNSLSSQSISPLTRVPTPHRVLFTTTTTTTTPNRIMTGTGTRETTQPSLRAVSKQLKKRNREMALGQGRGREDNRELSREPRKKRREEGACWGLPGGRQRQTPAHDASLQQQQQQNSRGSSEEREKGWTTTISAGSSEEGEERDKNDAAASSTSNPLSYTDHQEEEWCRPFSFSSSPSSAAPVSFETSARYDYGHESAPPSLSVSQLKGDEYWQDIIQMVQDTCLEASKRYIRAHCANKGARDGGGTSVLSRRSETGVARKARRRRRHKLKSRQASSSSFSSSSPSPEVAPPRQRHKEKGKSKRQNRTKNRTTTTPPSSSNWSPCHQPSPQPKIQCTSSLLPNISQICTLLWSRSQSLRLHDTDSIELHTARNMYWLLSWAETVAFAVVAAAAPTTISDAGLSPYTSVDSLSSSSSSSSSAAAAAAAAAAASVPGGRWYRSSTSSSSSSSALRQRKREWDREWEWEGFGEGVSEEGDKAKEGLESKNGRAVWEQQRIEEMIKRVFDEGGMLCEFLGYGEGVERLGRVREFCGV
ncbi:hypothetical protein B0T13DRAFT_400975 [Neurospora crassa]|nr:hypothetical protein B0T13DRAFT_400975 [Neurospora crassa]